MPKPPLCVSAALAAGFAGGCPGPPGKRGPPAGCILAHSFADSSRSSVWTLVRPKTSLPSAAGFFAGGAARPPPPPPPPHPPAPAPAPAPLLLRQTPPPHQTAGP